MTTYNLKISFLFFLCFLFYSIQVSSQNSTATITINKDPEIDALLAIRKQMFSENKTSNYKIQIFSGSNRQSAESERRKFLNRFDEWGTSIEYETPNYKIWVGNFRTRLEADRALMRIKKRFGNAFILKPKATTD